ncbi:uncharacterized protein N7459_002597 [Penicillium hispanicum]|uniref:uncharacterized protein n=1 Tax=Penicillium hispanicum TaxID=1080232 RepID=UPI002541A31F|nr:uncharacterized protein N7459_002597 [Penicillium hispanicum]KAJ5586832.1 hypothetical protein N7459_002597 [Penicillium hispanicum]
MGEAHPAVLSLRICPLNFFSLWSSCSLACTQSHKIYCAPKATPSNQESSEAPVDSKTHQPLNNGDIGHDTAGGIDSKRNQSNTVDIATSPALKALLEGHPQLRAQLHDMYQATQEHQWAEWYTPPTRGRPHGRGGRTPSRRSRGPWTAEKGFNRGLGRVRKLRQGCEDGTEAGPVPEGFMQFLALVNGSGQHAPARDLS